MENYGWGDEGISKEVQAEYDRLERRKKEIILIAQESFMDGARTQATIMMKYLDEVFLKKLREVLGEKYNEIEDIVEDYREPLWDQSYQLGSEYSFYKDVVEGLNSVAESVERKLSVPETCRDGNHQYSWNRFCGADVCEGCGDHKGLARCFCGFGLASGDRCEYWG